MNTSHKAFRTRLVADLASAFPGNRFGIRQVSGASMPKKQFMLDVPVADRSAVAKFIERYNGAEHFVDINTVDD